MAEFPSSSSDWRFHSGPLLPYIQDPLVTEIMVNGPKYIFVERNGVIVETNSQFESPDALMKLVLAIFNTLGKELNRKSPFVDARLPDGSRINCVIPPVSLDGPVLTIRKFSAQGLGYPQLLAAGMFDDKILYFLNQVVVGRKSILICGGTGTGKTSLLNAVASFIPQNERIITIEDTSELRIPNRNQVRMESRPKRAHDPGVSTQELLVNALRMRPDRIIIGECRGPEAWDMLVAMNTGHEGSMTTVHANSAQDGLRRLEAMILHAEVTVPVNVIREDIAATIDLVIHLERTADGKRRIAQVSEVIARRGGSIEVQDLFVWKQKSGHRSTGTVPEFLLEQGSHKFQFPAEFFKPESKIKLTA